MLEQLHSSQHCYICLESRILDYCGHFTISPLLLLELSRTWGSGFLDPPFCIETSWYFLWESTGLLAVTESCLCMYLWWTKVLNMLRETYTQGFKDPWNYNLMSVLSLLFPLPPSLHLPIVGVSSTPSLPPTHPPTASKALTELCT